MWLKTVLAVCLFCFVSSLRTPSCNEVSEMKLAIRGLIEDDFLLHPKALRLGFHDCVGGCNGCINLGLADNKGLEFIISALDEIYYAFGFNQLVSKADFWALGAVVAVELGISKGDTTKCPMICFNLKWGRTDKADCSQDNNLFPDAKKDGHTMFKYFEDEFGFTREEVTALMGAHTMGEAYRQNSGYKGSWVENEELVFDERFYQIMISKQVRWDNVNKDDTGKEPRWQFDGFTPSGSVAGFMINTDFEIFYDMSLDKNGKLTCNLDTTCGVPNTCQHNDCQTASTFQQAYRYSQNCPAFLRDFQMVFEKMLVHSYNPSDLTETHCPCP